MSLGLSWSLALLAAGLFLAYGGVYDSLVAQVNRKSAEHVEPFEETEVSRDWMGRRRWLDKVFARHKELFPNSHRRLLAKLLLVFGFITAVCWRFTLEPPHRIENPATMQGQESVR
jgi:hypothetical protein